MVEVYLFILNYSELYVEPLYNLSVKFVFFVFLIP